MNISEGTVVAAPKVGRPRKAVLVAPGGTLLVSCPYLKFSLVFGSFLL
jgi:hypothetical protein